MMGRVIRGGLVAAILAVGCGQGWAQTAGAGVEAGKRPMTFVDLQRMKRVGDPQVSPSGKWVMFSVVDVDLEKNSKVSHLWVVPLGASQGASSAAGSGRAERQVTFWKEGESGGRFSPDGKQVLFVATEGSTGLSQIFLAPWDDATGTLGVPNRLTNVSTEADGAVWSPDSKGILFTSRVYPECSNEETWLEEDTCDKQRDAAAAASPVKAQIWDHLLYRHWDHYVGEKRSHVLVVSASDGNAVRDLTPRRVIGDAEAPVFSLGGPMGYAWAPDSKEIAFVTNLDLVPAASTNNDVFMLRLDEPGAMPVKISTSLGGDDGPAYSPDGKYIAFRSQARAGYESDQYTLKVMDRTSGTLESVDIRLLNPPDKFTGSIDEFVWSPDGSAIVFSSATEGEEAVFVVDIHGGTMNGHPTFGQATLRGEYSDLRLVEVEHTVKRSEGDRKLAPTITLVSTRMTIDRPADIVANDMGGIGHTINTILGPLPKMLKATHDNDVPLTHFNDALISQLDLSAMEPYWFTGAEGAKVQGFIIRPPGFDASRKYPVKFLIHGGPQGAWGDAWSYRWNPELMAASGYVVVMVNPRGSTGYGQAFIDGVNGDWGGKAYVDLMKGLDYAETKYPFIDKTRECALGASYGGFMADWMLTHTDRFACIVTHDGMFNPQSAYGSTEELWFNEWEFRRPGDKEPGQPWRYASGPVANDPFRKWSPMLSIQNAKTPTLVIHSQRDYRLDVSEGMQLFTALQRMDVPSRMLYFPDEGHWILKPQNSKLWHETVADWCDRWTKTNVYAVGPAYVPMASVAPRPAAKASTIPGIPGIPGIPEIPKAKVQSPPKAQILPRVTTPVAPAAETAAVVPKAAAPAEVPKVQDRGAAGAERAAFAIAISAAKDEVAVGSDALVDIALKNISGKQILFGHHPGRDNPEFSYRIEVRNAAGKVVEETAYGRGAMERQQSESRSVDYVQPGGTAMQTAHLGKLFSLNKPGRYTVQVERRDAENKVMVKSNEITLNVVP